MTVKDIEGGDLFASGADILVNPVNCRGVMGAGLAKVFRERYPAMHEDYRVVCEDRLLRPGLIHVWQELRGPLIYNLPTKDDYRSPSQLSYVASGLEKMRELLTLVHYDRTSVALPALGAGLGGLDFEPVRELVHEVLGPLPHLVSLYAPR